MSNLNTILNKLGKIEELHETKLGKHEINLALIDDFTKEANNTIKIGDLLKKESNLFNDKIQNYRKLEKELENQKKLIESEIKNIDTKVQDVNSGYVRVSKLYDTIVNKASDLGFDYPKNIDTIFKSIEDLKNYTKSIDAKNVKL